jgi:hypothetical protein
MGAFGAIGPMMAFALGYYLLHKHWHSYSLFWVVLLAIDFVICAFQLFVMPETMPSVIY